MKNKVTVDKTAFTYALKAAAKTISASPSHLSLYGNVKLQVEDGALVVIGSNGDHLLLVRVPDDSIEAADFQPVLVPATIVSVVSTMQGDVITMTREGNGLRISDGIESSKIVAIYGDSQNISIDGAPVSYGVSDYRVPPTIQPGVDMGRMSATLWQKVVARCEAVGSDGLYAPSLGVILEVRGDGVLRVGAINPPATLLWWEVPRRLGYGVRQEFLAVVPKAAMVAAPVGGNDVVFGVDGNTFMVADVTGMWEFFCPIMAVGKLPNLELFVNLPYDAEVRMAAASLSRCCGISSNFMLVVGEGKGRVQTGRVRLTGGDGGVLFYTASDMGEFRDVRVTPNVPTAPFDITIANNPLRAAMACFPGDLLMRVSQTTVELIPVPDDGLRYVLAPLKAVWQ